MHFYVKIYVRIGTNWTAVISHYRTSLCQDEFLYMRKCSFETGFFLTKYSFPPLGLFSLQGLLDGPSALHYGNEWLQISSRFNVPQLSLGASGRTEHSAQNQHLPFCCSAAVLPGAIPSAPGSTPTPALVPATVRFLQTGFWLRRRRAKWQKEPL